MCDGFSGYFFHTACRVDISNKKYFIFYLIMVHLKFIKLDFVMQQSRVSNALGLISFLGRKSKGRISFSQGSYAEK